MIDMPDRVLDPLYRFLEQNAGKLSKRALKGIRGLDQRRVGADRDDLRGSLTFGLGLTFPTNSNHGHVQR
jgi:hypothetical protein